MNVGPGFVFAQNLEIVENERAAYGGLLAVELRMLSKRFRDEAQPDTRWEQLSKPFGGYTIFQALRAASNNFRHFEDWRAAAHPTDQERADVVVIAATRGWKVPTDDANLAVFYGRNLAWIIVHHIAQAYATLENHVTDAAEQLATAYGVPASPTLDVARQF
jgi:hypothetical protein